MGRSIAEIYNSIIAEKQTMGTLTGATPVNDTYQNLLADLTSASRVAEWRLWCYVMAVALWLHESLWDRHKAEVDERIANYQPGTLLWYKQQALLFQYGDLLNWDAAMLQYKYATVNLAARIVKLCSVTEPAGVVRIKAAKLAGNVVTPLTGPELAALQAYFNQIKYPGPLVCVSFSADLLKVGLKVKFNPLVDVAILQANVEAAINAYITGLPFDGRFVITALVDKIQQVPGVVDVVDVNIETRYGALPFAAVVDEYQTNAGYANIDPAFPLSSTIAYEAYV